MAKRKGAGNGINMQDLARVGAQARLDALREEQAALLAAFPGLRGAAAGQTRGAARASETAAPVQKSGRRRGAMTPAQRKAVGERMRAYWAARRAEKTGGNEQSSADQGGGRKAKGRKRARRK